MHTEQRAGVGFKVQHHQHSPSQFDDASDDDSLPIDPVRTGGPDQTGPCSPEELPSSASQSEVSESALVLSQRQRTPTLPAQLSSYPLLCPEPNPNSYFLLHHYSIHTSTTLFPLLPHSSRDFLLSVASAHPPLLSALLAISAHHYARLRNSSSIELQNRALFFSRKALSGLQVALRDPGTATRFETVATVLALCTNDVLMSGDVKAWRMHLRGASQLLSLGAAAAATAAATAAAADGGIIDALNYPASNPGPRPDSSKFSDTGSAASTDSNHHFLIKWFAAIDLFAGVSSLEKTLIPDGRYWSLGIASSPHDNIGDTTPRYVDDFLGFSLELMPLLSRISRMARLQQRRSALSVISSNLSSCSSSTAQQHDELSEDLDALLADNILQTETQLMSLLEQVSCSPSTIHSFPPILAQETQYTHHLFVYTALLHLYRRVEELPKWHPKPSFAMAKIIELFSLLRPESPASIVILWPLFSAGCETDDPGLRMVVRKRMIDLRRWGMGNVDMALDAMERYWEAGQGERWDVFLGRLGVDLVLF